VSAAALDTLAGRLAVHPGSAQPLAGSRPVIGAALMQRLTHGMPALQLPQRLASVFSLCGTAHRLTSARALRAALGQPEDPAQQAREDLLLRLWTAREHLQRLAIDLPRQVPVQGVAANTAWLRSSPLLNLPEAAAAESGAAFEQALLQQQQALLAWLEQGVFGQSAAQWLASWESETADRSHGARSDTAPSALQHWCATHTHPVARWLHAVRPLAIAMQWPVRSLNVLDEGEPGLRLLAARLFDEPDFALKPLWQAAAAETGCWTRQALPPALRQPRSPWARWLARLAELLHLARPGPWLRFGALRLKDGQSLAWTEMSRGLLLHGVHLHGEGAGAKVLRCRVLAPTEWNFHPDGTLALWLAQRGRTTREVAAAVAALDPCVEVDLHPQGAAHA
jgi:hypothetical protein